MEEVDLRWVKTSRSRRDGEINGRNGSNSCFCWHFVGFNLSLEVINRCFSEDECDFLLEERNEDTEFRNFSSILFFKVREFFIFDSLSSHSDNFFNESLNGDRDTFLEMTRILLVGLSNLRMSWIWLEPTLVKVVRMICL